MILGPCCIAESYVVKLCPYIIDIHCKTDIMLRFSYEYSMSIIRWGVVRCIFARICYIDAIRLASLWLSYTPRIS